MRKKTILFVSLILLFEVVNSQINELEYIAKIPIRNGVTPERIDALIGLKREPNTLLIAAQNQGSQCGWGTPSSIWKVYLNPKSQACDSVRFIQNLDLIQQTRSFLFEGSDGTIFTGSGWCGYKPPYFSTNYGNTWTSATKGVHPPNSTFSYVELNGNVYAGTGYNPYHGEVYKWLGNDGSDNWQRVFDYGIVRNIINSMVNFNNQMFVAATTYEVAGCETSIPVYRSADGINFIPTLGIPVCLNVKLVTNKKVLYAISAPPNSNVYKWDSNLSQWNFTGTFTITNFNFNNLISTDNEFLIVGIIGNDKKNGFYTSSDCISWEKYCEFDSMMINNLTYYNNDVFAGADDSRAHIYRLKLRDIIKIDTAICKGDSILINKRYLKNAGTYYDTLQSVKKRDSIIITYLSVNDTFRVCQIKSICKGDSLFIHKKFRKKPGIYIDSLKSVCNCDSVVITGLFVNPSYVFLKDTAICDRDSILIAGKYIKQGGTYYINYNTINSCDSNYIHSITINPLPQIDLGKGITLYPNGKFLFDAGPRI